MLSNRYPSNIGPLFNDEYEAVRLKDVDASTLASKKLCDPYVMGYIPTEKYPSNFFLNVTSLSSNQRSISFDNVLAQKNIGWGFAIVGNYNIGTPNMLAITNSNTLYNTASNPNNDCIVVMNKVQMAKMCARATQIWCYLAGILMPIEDEPDDDSVFFWNTDNRWFTKTLQIDLSEYEDMMTSADSGNPSRFRFSMNIGGVNRYFNICDADFNDFNIAKLHDENNEYTLYCTITYFSVNEARSYYGYSGTSTEVRCTPFYRIPLTEDNTEDLNTDICACFMPFYGVGWNDWRFYYHTDTDTLSIGGRTGAWNFAGYDIGNYPYTISLDELQSISGFSYNHDGIVYGKYLVNQAGYGTNYWGFKFYRQNRFSDGWKQYSLYHKSFMYGETYSASDYPKYNGKFAVAIFDENDTPTLTREPTLSSYPEMYDKLRPWQKLNADITDNEFDPADIPEWEPPGPSGDEYGDMYGNCGPNAGSSGYVDNFVTPWVLTASQLSDFGSHLWTDLLDFDAQGQPIAGGIWQNAKIAVDTYFATGSFDPASVMDFILSVRYFPINFQKADYATQFSVPAVYFGTGRVGVDVTTQPWIANSLGIYIDGGDFNLAEWGHKYNDWRDVGNASAEIFIPFCGTYPLPWTEVKDKTLELSYHIDIISGAMTVYVEATNGVDRDLVAVGSGLVGFEVPVTATSANRLNAAILSDLGGMSGTIADTNQIAAAFTGANASALAESKMIGPGPHAMADVDDGVYIDTGSFGGIKPTLTNALGPTTNPLWGLQMAKAAAPTVLGISQRPGITPTIMPGGRGWGALCGKRIPFIKVHKGRYPEDPKYAHTMGYPVFQSKTISSFSGYTQCMNVDTSGIPCTSEERAMIKALLEGGFYA